MAVPLPGTGAYSGSVIAALLDMPFKKSFVSIACGVFVAGIIITLLSMGGLMAIK